MDYETYINTHQTGRIISSDGTQVIGTWGGNGPAVQNTITTDTMSQQLVQGSQNRISQTKTNTPNTPNLSNIIAGTVAGAAGIAGMFAVKPSVKQFVSSATQKKITNSKDKQPPESKIDFKFSSGMQNSSEVKIVDISAIIKQSTQSTNTRIGADETNYIKPDHSNTSNHKNKQNSVPEVKISSASKDAIHKIEAQENNKMATFKEMSETELDGMDKTATQIEGTSSLVFGGPLYAAIKKSKYGKYSSMVLSGYKLFNKGVLMTGQIPLEKELNMNGDLGQAAGHEIATFGTGLLVPLIPVVGPAISFIDAAGSAITGISFIEEGTRLVEDGTRATFEAGFDSGYNKKWDATAPKIENLETYIAKLEKSIQNSESPQRKEKETKLLQKIQKYKSEIATRRNTTEFNTKMFNSEFTSFEP